MDFSSPRARRHSEPILPMINVVFLLLVFFLLTAQIAPRAPFEVTPPETKVETGPGTASVLFVSADGEMYFQGKTGGQAIEAISATVGPNDMLTVRADADVDAVSIVRLLTDLRAAGVEKIQLAGRRQ